MRRSIEPRRDRAKEEIMAMIGSTEEECHFRGVVDEKLTSKYFLMCRLSASSV